MARIRNHTAAKLAPIMARNGFRFSKDYRWGVTFYHRAVYRFVNTVKANVDADAQLECN